jgi:competence protein ComGC
MYWRTGLVSGSSYAISANTSYTTIIAMRAGGYMKKTKQKQKQKKKKKNHSNAHLQLVE